MLITHLSGILLLCVAGTYGLYDSSSDVVELTPSNFDKLVKNGDEIWLVEFYAPWCGHCRNLVPEYKKAATALKGIVRVGAVDADAHKNLGSTYGVKGFPTIKIFQGSKHTPYSQARTAEAMVEAALAAAKQKAFDSLGKKSSGKSSQQLRFKIPWLPIRKKNNTDTTKSPSVLQEKQNIIKLPTVYSHNFAAIRDMPTTYSNKIAASRGFPNIDFKDSALRRNIPATYSIMSDTRREIPSTHFINSAATRVIPITNSNNFTRRKDMGKSLNSVKVNEELLQRFKTLQSRFKDGQINPVKTPRLFKAYNSLLNVRDKLKNMGYPVDSYDLKDKNLQKGVIKLI